MERTAKLRHEIVEGIIAVELAKTKLQKDIEELYAIEYSDRPQYIGWKRKGRELRFVL